MISASVVVIVDETTGIVQCQSGRALPVTTCGLIEGAEAPE